MNFQSSGNIFKVALVSSLGLLASPTLADDVDVTIVLPGSSAMAWYPMIVAAHNGYFAEEGLNVAIESVDGSGQVLQTMAAGRAEFGAPGPAPVLNAISRGGDVKFFYNLFSRGLFVLAAQPGTDINDANDLAGKVIGVATADGAEVSFARSAMSSIGMIEDEDYTMLTIGEGGAAVAGFLGGDIDAYAASFVGIAVLKDKGIDIIDITPEELALFGNGLAVTGEFYRENPELVGAFGRAVAKATEWGIEHQDEVLAIGAEHNPQEGERTEYARQLLTNTISVYRPIPGLRRGELTASGWETWHDSILESGELEAPLEDLDAAWTNEFVDSYTQ